MKYLLNDNINLVLANVNDIDMLLNFQKEIIEDMPRKEYFTPLLKEEFSYPIENNGRVYMAFSENEMIGLYVLTINPLKEIIDEYKLENSDNVAIFDGVMIKKEYRGSNLQAQGMEIIYNDAKKLGVKQIIATVHPENIYSIRNFQKEDYKHTKTIPVHGGERLIFQKEVN